MSNVYITHTLRIFEDEQRRRVYKTCSNTIFIQSSILLWAILKVMVAINKMHYECVFNIFHLRDFAYKKKKLYSYHLRNYYHNRFTILFICMILQKSYTMIFSHLFWMAEWKKIAHHYRCVDILLRSINISIIIYHARYELWL